MKSPLAIYVVSHPASTESGEYSKLIFSLFNRDITDPLSRGIGIPVFYRSVEPLAPIPDDYENTAIILLIDYNFVNSPAHEKFARQLVNKRAATTKIIPVALDNTAFNLADDVANLNFIRLYQKTWKQDYLVAALSHEIARHMYGPGKKNVKGPAAPLKLFISHAKADGVEIAQKIKVCIESDYALKTFFDANDIAFGYDFPQEIERYVQHAVLVAVHSDKYASREWCRREVLLAKQHNRPIIILSCLTDGESRGFPYMSNVRTVHYQQLDDHVWPRLISAVMQETLRIKYQERWLRFVLQKSKFKLSKSAHLSSYPPELVTLVANGTRHMKTFVYPDPPLGSEELQLLGKLDKGIRYVTPLSAQYEMLSHSLPRSSVTIGLSISECENMQRLGMDHAHLQDAMIETARHLLNLGFNIAYGGDPNYTKAFNFTEMLLQLQMTYRSDRPQKGRVQIYAAFPYHVMIAPRREAELKRFATIVRVSTKEFRNWENVKYETAGKEQQAYIDNVLTGTDMESRMIRAQNLTAMRELMARNISARVVMGGKLGIKTPFSGKYPGILEETLIDLEAGHRIFLIDSLGGCAQMIASLLKGKDGAEMSELRTRQQAFDSVYNSKVSGEARIDYDKAVRQLRKGKGNVRIYSAMETHALLRDLVASLSSKKK